MPTWMRREIGKNGELSPAKARAVLAQWRSMQKLAELARRWREEGVSPKHQKMYGEFEAWRYHDFHLYSWEADQAKKSKRRRKDLYRNFAAQLSRKYKVLILEDFKLNRIAENEDIDEDAKNASAASNRHMVAPNEMRSCLVNAFNRCGEVVEVDPCDSTRTCHVCGVVNTWDQATELEHRCTACGSLWDQDDNAAVILRRRGERLIAGDGAGTSRGSQKRSDSSKKAKKKRPSRSYRELHRRRQEEAARV